MYNIRLKLRYNNSHKLIISKRIIYKRIIYKRIINKRRNVKQLVIIIELIEFHVFSTFYNKNKIKIYFLSKIIFF